MADMPHSEPSPSVRSNVIDIASRRPPPPPMSTLLREQLPFVVELDLGPYRCPILIDDPPAPRVA